MLRKITRNKQVTIPKEFMERLYLNEGDYVTIECENNSIRMRPVVIDEFSHDDYEKLAFKLDQLKNEPGTSYSDSKSARRHLKRMMK
ncbi:MAG: AbrB/MazE/SpoVT family DNA-binding domain-containing protein [Deltaproteobacteria bacterium]|nr:AbrB/MazE/SpoVT family DNA-binding domain-containing protein [Deltaproteobacteria bacterium]MBL7205603.1 AbrB/MazE/SpoVT family DNA-binding domain-containing protein [Desulfobacteraceae bacterium]